MKIEQNNSLCFKPFFQKIIKTKIFFLLILALIVFLIYGKSINFEFLNLDDEKLIGSNINFISDIRNLPKIFLTGCYYTKNSKDYYYRPILSLSFILESSLFGKNSKISHITNIILFILSIYLMYVFLLKLNLNKSVLQFVILLMVVHPILTSVSVWIAGRNDSLLTIFTILSIINILEYLQNNKLKYFIFSVFFFAIALFTKESAIVLLLIVPILMFSINKFSVKKLVVLYFGFLLFIILYAILRSSTDVNSSLLLYLNNYIVFFKNMIYSFIIYISTFLTVFDIPVCLFDFSPDILSIIKAILFISLITFIYYSNFINRKFIVLGLSFFILYLLPTFFASQLFFHRLLLPSLGIVLIIVLLIQKIIEKYPISTKYFLCFFIILFLILSYSSYLQANKYKDNRIFTLEGYKNAPRYYHFLINMGTIYLENQDYDKALEFMLLTEKYKPGLGLLGIASIFYYKNNLDQAEFFLKKAMDFNKDDENIYVNLSLIYENKHDYKKSLEYAIKAYNKNPYNIDIAINLARNYVLNEDYKKALDIYLYLLKLDNQKAGYYYSIGFLYDKLYNKEKALEYVKKSVQLDENNQKYRDFLSNLLDN